MKIKEQTRKLASGCSKYRVANKAGRGLKRFSKSIRLISTWVRQVAVALRSYREMIPICKTLISLG